MISDRVLKKIDLTDDCWLWTGSGTGGKEDYGRVYHDGTRSMAHRYIYEQTVGPIPEGLQLDHLCRTPRCVNPDHLEPVTASENARRKWEHIEITHCKRGHEFTEENTARDHRGHKRCRECNRLHAKAAYHGEKLS